MRTAWLLLLLAGAAMAGPEEWLVMEQVDRRGRRPFNPDTIFLRYLLDPASAPPKEGESVGKGTWKRVAVDDRGRVGGSIRYAYAAYESAQDRIVLATLHRGATLFVNGDAFVGDIYGGSWFSGVPVPLRKGTNHLYVRGVRGSFRLTFDKVRNGVVVSDKDGTVPDLLRGERMDHWASRVVMNASAAATGELVPFGVRRRAVRSGFRALVREPGEVHRRTFRSAIDGSVQQYAVRPPGGKATGIVLTLHGAGVDCLNQARSYSTKTDLWIVAPTNRRPFGFDWQDWGRQDAYEVLAEAMKAGGIDPDRIYLTGHSMGGHGAWHLAANDPDRWAAIAPSAGWSSFDSYVRRPGGVHDELWRGADGSSLTMTLLPNLVSIPTFILHGEKDDNVPAREAHLMEDALRKAGGRPESHYQEGAGHWWDGRAAAGVDCVDWPGIFALFEKSRRRPAPADFEFVCADPGIDAEHHGIRVEQPLEYGRPLRVAKRGKAVTTENVRRLRLPAGRYVLDGQELSGGWLLRGKEGWTAARPVAGEKTPARSGPFKRAFDNRFVFVYGDEVSMKRARYDAQTWWYRANGDVEVTSDERFLAGDFAGRNVILYGNATSNRAFDAVLPAGCPVRVAAGVARVGERSFRGEGIGCVFVYPRQGEDATLVGAFAHTGTEGARLGYALLPFVSGVGYPDYAVFDTDILAQGDGGVVAAGWFRHDWTLPAR